MKFFALVIVLLAVIGLLAATALEKDLGDRVFGSLFGIKLDTMPAASSSQNILPPVKTSGGGSKMPVPAGFRGPSSDPRIIGPTGNPPNY